MAEKRCFVIGRRVGETLPWYGSIGVQSTCVWLACAAVRRLGVHPDGNVTCETREHWEGDLFLIGSGRSEYVCVVT